MDYQIRTLIIDDEQDSILLLKNLLRKYCPEVIVVDTAENVEEGVKCIEKNRPDILFLDINMPDGNGFEVLDKVSYQDFEVIFITAFDKYAMKAFEFSALHYLLKPIEYTELQKAIQRYQNSKSTIEFERKIRVLNDSLQNRHKKIILPTAEGLSVIELDDIMRCESQNNYTTFFLTHGDKIIVSRAINNYEEILSDLNFVRVHSKHLVNLQYIKRYVKGRGGYIILQDNSQVDVSEGKKREFLRRLNEYARS